MNKYKQKEYKQPEAHHWIILRLLEASVFVEHYKDEHTKSMRWLIGQLGGAQVLSMMEQLEQLEPEANK